MRAYPTMIKPTVTTGNDKHLRASDNRKSKTKAQNKQSILSHHSVRSSSTLSPTCARAGVPSRRVSPTSWTSQAVSSGGAGVEFAVATTGDIVTLLIRGALLLAPTSGATLAERNCPCWCWCCSCCCCVSGCVIGEPTIPPLGGATSLSRGQYEFLRGDVVRLTPGSLSALRFVVSAFVRLRQDNRHKHASISTHNEEQGARSKIQTKGAWS